MFETNPITNLKIEKCFDHYKYNDFGYVWRKIFIVDNFYKNPNEIRDYALSCDLKTGEEHCGGLIGKRVFEENQEMVDKLKPIFSELCQNKEWYNLEWDEEDFNTKWDNQSFMVNVTKDEDINGKFTHHKDNEGSKWAALVYLSDGPGGTNFYQWKEEWPLGDRYDLKQDIVFTSEMKYNRMVMYESRQTHEAILEKGMFTEYPRLAQVFFM